MKTKSILKLLMSIALVLGAWWSYTYYLEITMEPTRRSDRLFKPYDEAAYRIAQKIERGQSISIRELKNLPNGVNTRYGQEITLLFHALSARNIEAIDALLEAGADPYMIDRPSTGSARGFVYYLTLTGHPTDPQLGFPFINQLIRLYLKHGGDPNRRLGGANKSPLIADVALMDNYEGIDILLEVGANPWAVNDSDMNVMTRLAANGIAYDVLNQLIDRGYFDNVSLPQLQNFILWISSYSQRGDERSLANQAIGRRVLKRHPNYPEDRYTERLFQGPIPWAEIAHER